MNRTILTTNFGEDRLRHTVRIESDPCEENDFRSLMLLLQNVTMYQPDLLRHISPCPELGRWFYDAGKWVIESVNIVPRPVVDEG